jgi:hypothetical protein
MFPAGLPITVLARSRLRVKICVDPPGGHLSGRCHSMFVTADSIREDDHADPTGEPAPLPTGLAGARAIVEGRRWVAL